MLIAAIIYFVIGGFINGLVSDGWEDPSILIAVIWPIILFCRAVSWLIEFPFKLGQVIRKWRRGKENDS